MEVIKVLRMNAGVGETSYASNSLAQKKALSTVKPIINRAIIDLCSTKLPANLCIADLGCSSGPNTLFLVSELIKTVDKMTCKESGKQPPEYSIYLNDLPGNDFNTIFKSLPSFHGKMRSELGSSFGQCFVTGVPGSFYGRIFPSKSLHFVHSSSSLHWLSQVPKGLESNKGNIYIGAGSPPAAHKAYYDQFQKDFGMFLKCRSEEVVDGGRMVLSLLGRKSEHPYSKESCYIWELLATALSQMASKGLIEEEKVNSFVMPQYMPSLTELRNEVEKQGSFAIDCVDAFTMDWNTRGGENETYKVDGERNVAKTARAAAEALLVNHFGEAIVDDIFHTFAAIVGEHILKEKIQTTIVIASMTKI